MKKVVVGLSGGVDSAMAAFLLKEQGYDVLGVTMCVMGEEHREAEETMIRDALQVADRLSVPFETVDFRRIFKEKVMDYFTGEYIKGRTPNPCVMCNRYVKWEAIWNYAKERGADYMATGHYARIERLSGGRYAVRNSVTAAKDQTYVLYGLTQEQLAHTLMPVGGYTKEEIRSLAQKAGFSVADKKDSQEICFIPDHDYAAFIKRERPEELQGPGNFVTADGILLGRHEGIIHYTVGQRKGLGIAAGRPVFVTGIRPDTNEVVIGEDGDVMSRELICSQVSFMAAEPLKPGESMHVKGKIRYAHRGTAAKITMLDDGRMKAEFEEPVRAVTPGQAAVFYKGEYVACGGIIE